MHRLTGALIGFWGIWGWGVDLFKESCMPIFCPRAPEEINPALRTVQAESKTSKKKKKNI